MHGTALIATCSLSENDMKWADKISLASLPDKL